MVMGGEDSLAALSALLRDGEEGREILTKFTCRCRHLDEDSGGMREM